MREGNIKSSIFYAIVAVVWANPAFVHADLSMSPTATYYVPGLTSAIKQVSFNDLNGDGTVEMLASDGQRVLLYSSTNETVLFETTIDAGAVDHSIVFDDVDRDHIPDILIGCYFENGTFERDTVCRVDIYYGASLYTNADTLFFEADIDFEVGLQSPSSFVCLEGLDVTGDGYRELFVAYDQCRLASLPFGHVQTTSGLTCLYAGFPEVSAWTRPALMRNISELEPSVTNPLFIASRYENVSVIPGDRLSKAWTEIFSAEGDSLGAIREIVEPLCAGDSTSTVSGVEFMCAGNIRGNLDETDILVRYCWHQVCYQSDAITFQDSGTELRLYRLIGPGRTELLWSDKSPSMTGNFHYSADFPGYFFAATDGVIHKLSGLNGEIVESSVPMDADTIIWLSNPEMGGGDFVAVKNQTVRVYEIDTQTGIIDGDQTTALPARFELGNPYPNPFNSSCVIEYWLPRHAHTTITIHNILGQEVATVVDEIRSAGAHSACWNGIDQSGKPVASGVYLYRINADGFANTKKMVLLK
ncbi:MAG: T9SS type A sorting domain-containing protein [Candidatus Zixiibacteriota bacterium]|nr:MAG: T9SS type A sorting domain-containing protein [candidate division Zixibacteria bacterium]